MGMTILSVRPRFFVGALTFERVIILHFCFRLSTVWVTLQVKFVTELNRMTPSRSTVTGHVNVKYILPSCSTEMVLGIEYEYKYDFQLYMIRKILRTKTNAA
jgi:uncharacterized protein (UPF0216 family)